MNKLLLLALTTLAVQAQFLLDPYRFAAPVNTNTLNDGLVAYYKLDETPSGVREDSGPNNLDLAETGTVGANTGIITNAAVFTDTNTKSLSVADDGSFDFGAGSFTIAFWTYPVFLAEAKNMVGKGVCTGNQGSFIIRHDGGGNLVRFAVSTTGTCGGATTDATSASSMGAANTWYFVVAWHDTVNNTINVQLNNGTIGSTAFAGTVFDSTAPFVVGGQVSAFTGGNAWNGRLDEVGVWNRVLTADERTYLYDSGAPGPEQTCCPFP